MSFDFQSSKGWRCEPCFRMGRLRATHEDGQLLTESDRCSGCGEVICDRHQRRAQKASHTQGWDWHNYVQRVVVTEVPT